MYHTPVEESYITRQLVSVDKKNGYANEGFSQMTSDLCNYIGQTYSNMGRKFMKIYLVRIDLEDIMTCIYDAWSEALLIGHDQIQLKKNRYSSRQCLMNISM